MTLLKGNRYPKHRYAKPYYLSQCGIISLRNVPSGNPKAGKKFYGVKIYRDNIAVKSYGFPKAQLGFDWLKLVRKTILNIHVGRAHISERRLPYIMLVVPIYRKDDSYIYEI